LSDVPRILLLVTDLEYGGTPLRLVRTAIALSRIGFEPILGCLGPEGPLSAELRRRGLETFACDARHRYDAGCLVRLARVIRRFDPDLIHATLFHANMAARLVGKWDRHRPVLTASATIEIERRWHLWGESLTAGLSDFHLANSEAVRRHLCDELGFSPQRVAVVPNGIDLDRIDSTTAVDRVAWNIPLDEPLLVWAGRMDPVKGLDTLISAIDMLSAEHRFHVVLIGDGPKRQRLEARLSGLRSAQRVRMLGWREDVVGWFKAADLFVFPSRTEGCPNSLIEAMASGCTVAASDLPACRELIEPGVSGELVPPDQPTAWVDRLTVLMRDTARRKRLGQEARRRIQRRFALPTVTKELGKIYVALLNREHSEIPQPPITPDI
jgi:glycosyltransferase involved in cell wall biosynthesis